MNPYVLGALALVAGGLTLHAVARATVANPPPPPPPDAPLPQRLGNAFLHFNLGLFKGSVAGAAGGAGLGASTGALAGSVVPGLGTAAGGVAGGLFGAWAAANVVGIGTGAQDAWAQWQSGR